MKFNLKLFVLVGVLAGFRDVCGTEKKGENKDYDGFIVAGLTDDEKKELEAAVREKRVIKAVYKTEVAGLSSIIHGKFKYKLSSILVWDGKEVKKVEAKNLASDIFSIGYVMSEKVDHTVYFIFNDELLNSTANMFFMCSRLISADFRCFNTSNVKDMSYMFYMCSSLTELNLSLFDTSKVENMLCMFYECSALKELDLSNFNTSKVTNMADMFDLCTSLNLVFLPLKDVDIKKRCICCVYGPVLWNNHEVGGLNPNIVQLKKSE